MTHNSKIWKQLSEGEYQSFWETPKDKGGECDYVFRLRGMFLYFTPKEFLELLGMCKEVEDVLFPPHGDCYK